MKIQHQSVNVQLSRDQGHREKLHDLRKRNSSAVCCYTSLSKPQDLCSLNQPIWKHCINWIHFSSCISLKRWIARERNHKALSNSCVQSVCGRAQSRCTHTCWVPPLWRDNLVSPGRGSREWALPIHRGANTSAPQTEHPTNCSANSP